jgi:hypothetical protein
VDLGIQKLGAPGSETPVRAVGLDEADEDAARVDVGVGLRQLGDFRVEVALGLLAAAAWRSPLSRATF